MTVHTAEENILRVTKGTGETGSVVVPFASGEGIVTVLAKELGQEGVARVQCAQIGGVAHVVARRGAEDIRTGVNAGASGYADRAAQSAHVAVLVEGNAFAAESVQSRRPYNRVTVGPDGRSAVVVSNQEEYVWLR